MFLAFGIMIISLLRAPLNKAKQKLIFGNQSINSFIWVVLIVIHYPENLMQEMDNMFIAVVE